MPPSVVGLEGGRIRAVKHQRRKRRNDRATSSVLVAILIGAVSGAGYVGYTMYTEHQAHEAAELERRFAEIQASQQGRSTNDIIDDVGSRAKWNGNAPPDVDRAADKIVVIEP